MSFIVELPVPPPLNNAYVNVRGRGRIKSVPYRAWRRAAVLSIFAQVPAALRIGGPVEVFISLPAKMRGDVDGRIKAVLDALVDSNRIDDDRYVLAVTACKRVSPNCVTNDGAIEPDKPTAFVRVTRSPTGGTRP